MAPVRVLGPAKSTGVARVLVCLEEVGAEYELVHVHIPAGEHKVPDHVARSPFGQVPAFEDGDLVLFESRAISKYILRKHASELLRASKIYESMVDVWVDVESQTFDRIMAVITFQCFVVPMFMGGTTDHRIVEENLEKLKEALQVYETRLSKSRYLAGDFVSLADLSHCPMMYYLLETPHAPVLNAFPHVKSWISVLMDRPSIKKVVEHMKTS